MRKPGRQSFADMAREVRARPPMSEPFAAGVADAKGVRWVQTNDSISAGQAHALVEQGALVAWDPCGCGGYCGLTWFSPDQVARLLAAGSPTVRSTRRRRGSLSEWATEDGRVLVVAEDAVRWADLMD